MLDEIASANAIVYGLFDEGFADHTARSRVYGRHNSYHVVKQKDLGEKKARTGFLRYGLYYRLLFKHLRLPRLEK